MATEDRNVTCPHYKYNEAKSITCEGPVEHTKVTWKWESIEDRKNQMTIYCCKYWKRCEIRRCLVQNRTFENDDED